MTPVEWSKLKTNPKKYAKRLALRNEWRRGLSKGSTSYRSQRRFHFAAQLRRNHGLEVEDYAWLLLAQNFRCGGCQKLFELDSPPESSRIRTAHVDHCHETGRIRGLLCFTCNHTLGRVHDDPSTLERLAAYLRSGKEAANAGQ